MKIFLHEYEIPPAKIIFQNVKDFLANHRESVEQEDEHYISEYAIRELMTVASRPLSISNKEIILYELRKELGIELDDPRRVKGPKIGVRGVGLGKRGMRLTSQMYVSHDLAREMIAELEAKGLISWPVSTFEEDI